MIKVSCFGTDGLPVFDNNGVSSIEIDYDERGNEIRRSFFGTDGEPVLSNEFIAGRESVYDERGNEIERSYFDIDGKPILSHEGIAGWESAFDEHNNEIRRGYFGVDGEPILNEEKYAGWESVFNERGKEIEVRFIDTNGNLTCNKDGWAVARYEYNERNNVNGSHYYDENGDLLDMFEKFPCVVAQDANTAKGKKSIKDYYIIVKLGNWELAHYRYHSDMIFDDFMTELNKSSDVPTEVWYLEYDSEHDKYELFSDSYQYGQMNLRFMDHAVSLQEYEIILNASSQPTEKPFPTRSVS